MSIRYLACYVCRQQASGIDSLIPAKCENCGESVFINLEHTVYNQEFYSTKEEEKPKSKVLDESDHIPSTVDLKGLNVFTGLAFNDDDSVDLDSMEHEDFLAVTDYFQAPGVYSFIAVASGVDEETECLVVIENLYGELIHKELVPFSMIGYDHSKGLVTCGSAPVEVTVNCQIRVKVYFDYKAQGLTLFDVTLEHSYA